MNHSRKIPFSTLQDLNKNSKGRKIVLFGAGPISEKTARILDGYKIDSIVDNAPNLWGKIELNVEILPPKSIYEKDNSYIVICTTSFAEVSAQLNSYGLNSGTDYCVSPILNDLRVINELEGISKKILFTSGSPKDKNPLYGGGVYELTVDGDEWKYKKIITGNCYGLIKFNDNYISVDTDMGIFEFDINYNIVRSKKLPSGVRAHGVQYSKKHKNFYVAGSYYDGVLILDEEFNIIDDIKLSYKKERYGVPKHHCNDCLVVDDSLFISMFSVTGSWQNDVFDGGVVEYDILTKEKIGPIVQNLWMPHNIQMINGSLHLLNSLQGQLLTNNFQVVGEFPAFTRGLDYDGVYYYIGQSRNRNYSKNIGVSKNISIDAGIIVFDEYTKASRFLQLPPRISEIHSILVI
jgi:hypothetical protein